MRNNAISLAVGAHQPCIDLAATHAALPATTEDTNWRGKCEKIARITNAVFQDQRAMMNAIRDVRTVLQQHGYREDLATTETEDEERTCCYCGFRRSQAVGECRATPYVRGGHDFATEEERNTPSAATETETDDG